MAFSEELIQQVWETARGMTELSPELWRRDECGAWIRREHYRMSTPSSAGRS